MTSLDDVPSLKSDDKAQTGYSALSPDAVIDAVESLGYFSDGRQLALNSYENRVYQVGLEEGDPLIVKFYRPGRWSDEAILEEHSFIAELAEQSLPVVGPISFEGQTLHWFEGYRFSVFPRRGGRAPEFDDMDNLFTLGQVIGQMHQVAGAKPFEHRPRLDIQSFGYDAVKTVSEGLLPDAYRDNYLAVTEQLLSLIEKQTADYQDIAWIRCHGDCHVGNILWRDDKPNFVDFDDTRMAPAIQDLWMMLSGEKHHQKQQLIEVVEGYEVFSEFDHRQLNWIEPLRTLRMMNYCAWLASRWDDPAFPMHFPWFNTDKYWSAHIVELREQQFALEQPMYTSDFLQLY